LPFDGEPHFQFLLIGVEGLACQIDRGLRGLHGGTVLLYIELRRSVLRYAPDSSS